MKCALEMKVAVEEKLLQEEIERKRKKQERYEQNMNTYLTEVFPKMNDFVEELLLKGNGQAEFLIRRCQSVLEQGFYYIGEKGNPYRTKLPYWDLFNHPTFSTGHNLFCLEHYVDFLKSLCYDVSVESASFYGNSSTGKSKELVCCSVIKISIPTNPCN